MSTIQIDQNTVVRTVVRKGSNADRQSVVLEEGEIGYTTDTSRLFVGDGNSQGGVATSTKFFGSVASFAEIASQDPQPGDFFVLDTGLYARNSDGSGNIDDATGYTNMGLAATIGAGLDIAGSGEVSVVVDDVTIELDGSAAISIKQVPLSLIENIAANNVLINNTAVSAIPNQLQITANSVLGRIDTNDATAVSFDDVLSNATNPTLAQATVVDLAGATGGALVVASAVGKLSRIPVVTGITSLNAFFYYDSPYQIFGNKPLPTNGYYNGIKLAGDGTMVTIDPWITAGVSRPDNVKAAIVYGSVDNTSWPISTQGGSNPRTTGYDGRAYHVSFTVFASRNNYTSTFQPIFNAGAGEGRRAGINDDTIGSGQTNVILDSSGTFLVGGFGNKNNTTPNSTVNLYCKLFLVGYAL